MPKSFASNTDGDQEKILNYVQDIFRPEDSVLREIRERSEKRGLPSIQVGSMDGLHLEVLTRSCGAAKAVEVGTLGGYSGVSIARGLKPGGMLHTLELNPEHAEVARESFRLAKVLDHVQIHVGPALESLERLTSLGPFDLVFIDADKDNYPGYLAWAAENLKVGGVLLGDNTLAWGMIADHSFEDPKDEASVVALRKFNQEAAQSGRFRTTMLPTGEGLTFGVKLR